ncbi:MAG: putative enoyl-CoA hydratase echA17, partial [Frankiales bacterium]|nr:putative enoyl-CoA hydratase echA17 [Frankiales bacterium]
MGEFVRLEVDGGVGTIRLDRPKMNAINADVVRELREAAVEAGSRADVRAVVLYGGERVFAAGADIKEMSSITYAEMLSWGSGLQEALKVVAKLPKPVVAAVTGYALGGGFELALTADFRVLG